MGDYVRWICRSASSDVETRVFRSEDEIEAAVFKLGIFWSLLVVARLQKIDDEILPPFCVWERTELI